MKKLFILKICIIILLVTFFTNVYCQISFDSLLKSINKGYYTTHKIDTIINLHNKYNGKEQIKLKKDNHLITIENDSLGHLSKLKIDNKDINNFTILKGNDTLYFFDGLKIDYEYIEYFNNGNNLYFYFPMYIKDCHGSSCRNYMCLLTQIDSNSKIKTFFFGNAELENDFYFRITDDNKLLYLNIKISFLYPEQFKSYLNYLKEPDNVLYQITSLVYNKNNEKWEEYKDLKDKEYKIVIKANGQYDKNKIQVLYKYWP